MPNRTFNNGNYRYGFNGKENDNEVKGTGNSQDFGARIYDGRIGRWLSLDPLIKKYPGESPYCFVGNSPIVFIDPDGREKIVVTGGEYTANTWAGEQSRYKFNFVEPAIKQFKAYQAKAGTEQVTWAVMNAGYTESQISDFQQVAKDNGVNFILLNSAEELTNYINSKTTSSEELSDSRTADKITDVSVFGHGLPGKLALAYHQKDKEYTFDYDTDDAKKLNPDAFNKAQVCLYTCNSMTQNEITGESIGKVIQETINAQVVGFYGKTDYSTINNGQDRSFYEKYKKYSTGFNVNGSVNLPSAGTKKGLVEGGEKVRAQKIVLGKR